MYSWENLFSCNCTVASAPNSEKIAFPNSRPVAAFKKRFRLLKSSIVRATELNIDVLLL